MKDKYEYLAKISPETERHIIKDRTTIPLFSLNRLINTLLEEHYKKGKK